MHRIFSLGWLYACRVGDQNTSPWFHFPLQLCSDKPKAKMTSNFFICGLYGRVCLFKSSNLPQSTNFSCFGLLYSLQCCIYSLCTVYCTWWVKAGRFSGNVCHFCWNTCFDIGKVHISCHGHVCLIFDDAHKQRSKHESVIICIQRVKKYISNLSILPT